MGRHDGDQAGPGVRLVLTSLLERFYLVPQPRRLSPAGRSAMLVGRGYPKSMVVVDPARASRRGDDATEAALSETVVSRLPGFVEAERLETIVGFYDVTPDWHPVLGPVPAHLGLHLACGGSGHCFKLAPAIGELVAAGIIGRLPDWAR